MGKPVKLQCCQCNNVVESGKNNNRIIYRMNDKKSGLKFLNVCRTSDETKQPEEPEANRNRKWEYE